ncbi:ABC transporter ATP-binding protein [Methanomassiliicoccus luminyensis]|uniref:ABC transporter ATP-binding protein n=1 Tax=Methanomassiliicoccus luminyensis TaxID=1080712 RepID=UPI0003818623|nr:ABC transporter ATP-binding protein [Methanomassiliicoccus luminyensis]
MTVEIKAARKLRDFVLDVDLSIPDGEILVLIGRNGSGKSTVLRMVAGLMSPDQGRISVGGRTFFDSSRGIDLLPEERDVGFMFQNYAVFPHLTVYGNLAYGLRNKKIAEDEILQQVRPLMEGYGLWNVKDVRAGKLSGGQKQRVALLRSLVARPCMFLLDEPLSAIDRAAQATARKEIRSLIRSTNASAIVVTHDPSDAVELGDRICLINQGRIETAGTPEDLPSSDRAWFFGAPRGEKVPGPEAPDVLRAKADADRA